MTVISIGIGRALLSLKTRSIKMKEVRKWISRVSLSVFLMSTLYITTHVNDFPEVAHIESKTEAFANLIQVVFRYS